MASDGWALPPEIFMEILEHLRPSVAARDQSEAWTSPKRYTNWWTSKAAVEESAKSSTLGTIPPTVSMDFIRLRAVSREFYNMCTPLLYDEFNVNGDYKQLRDTDFPLIVKYGRFVRNLRVIVASPSRESPEDEKREFLLLIQNILPLTPHLSSLHLYLGSENGVDAPEDYLDTLHNAIHWNTLHTFGVYSMELLYSTWTSKSMTNGVLKRLTEMARHKRKSLMRLDIANESISTEAFDSIRSHFTSLESLTIRRSLRFDGNIWDAENQRKWNPNHNLICLQLIDCTSVYSAHVPKILHLFPSLKRLLISACGNWGDVIPPARAKGWSERPDALHRQPPHLEVFHIEHMVTWEILAMGEISSKTVIVTGLRKADLVASFKTDPEIFPDLQHVRFDRRVPRHTFIPETVPTGDGVVANVDAEATASVDGGASLPVTTEPTTVSPRKVDELEQICQTRGVLLTKDATYIAFSQL